VEDLQGQPSPQVPTPAESTLVPVPPDGPIQATPGPRPPAVAVLLKRADAEMRAGNPAQAAAELERAVRIAPHDGELWLRLAWLRMQQGEWEQAEATGLKCVSLTEGDPRIRKSAWEIVGAARAARGDIAGAKAARQRGAAVHIP
jgi:Flp pilus assembly protein TadD